MTIWLEVGDLRSADQPTLELCAALDALTSGQVRFVQHGASAAWSDLAVQLAAQAPPRRPPDRESKPLQLPEAKGSPLASASDAQLQAFGELGRFGANLLRHQSAAVRRQWAARARHRPPPGPTVESQARAGDTLLALGASWRDPGFETLARTLRDDRRMRIGVALQDLLPIRRPEWARPGLAPRFEAWCRHVLPGCDLLLAASQHTAADIRAYARETRLSLPGQLHVLPGGSSPATATVPADRAPKREYVLLAAPMEPSRNHALAFRIWSMLLDEVRAGARAAASVPDLVFAGPIGWHSTDLMHMLDNTRWLGGRITLIHDPAEAERRALTQHCLFTLCPSLAEGSAWPVVESLALGKPCLAARAAALPEAGALACYFDPENLTEAYHAVASVLDDRPGLTAWEAQIRREYQPVSWADTARALLAAVAALPP